MTAVGDARKRRQESELADETVRVPAALMEALREALDADYTTTDQHPVKHAARALVDAAERPDEDEPCNYGAHFAGCKHEIPDVDEMCPNCVTPWKCNGPHVPWPPAPLSSPRRTRDEGSGDEAEAAATEAWSRMGVEFVEGKRTMLPDWGHFAPAFVAGYRQSLVDAADAIQALHPGEVKNSVIWLRDRAARLAGEDDRHG